MTPSLSKFFTQAPLVILNFWGHPPENDKVNNSIILQVHWLTTVYQWDMVVSEGRPPSKGHFLLQEALFARVPLWIRRQILRRGREPKHARDKSRQLRSRTIPEKDPFAKPWNRNESDFHSIARFHSNEYKSEIQVDIVQ